MSRRLGGVSALIPLPGEERAVPRVQQLEELLRRAALWIDAFDVRSPKDRRPDRLLADIAAALGKETHGES